MARVVMSRTGQARVHQTVDHALSRVARMVANDAQRYAPVDTGAMRAGIEAEDGRSGVARVSVSRNVPGDDPNVPIYVEYGTRHMGAEPFMRPALFQRRVL